MRLVFALLMAFATPVMAQQAAPTEILDAAVDDVIRPAMSEFRYRAVGMEDAMGALCAAPSTEMVDVAVEQFGLTVQAHSAVGMLRLGPLMEDNRADRLLFWPDRRGIGLRQVQAILADQDETAISAARLRDKSVAVQGLGALEFVLFGTGAETLQTAEGAFRCSFGQAIADNIASIAGEMEQGWASANGIGLHLTQPRADYADYRTETEALEALVGQAAHGLEAIRDTRLKPFMASADAAAKPKQALYWRSGQTLASIRAGLEGLERLIARSDIAGGVGEANMGLGDSIAFEFRNAYRAIDLVTLPIEEAVADEQQARALAYLLIVVNSLHDMVGEQLPTALGLSVGFSSLDGD